MSEILNITNLCIYIICISMYTELKQNIGFRNPTTLSSTLGCVVIWVWTMFVCLLIWCFYHNSWTGSVIYIITNCNYITNLNCLVIQMLPWTVEYVIIIMVKVLKCIIELKIVILSVGYNIMFHKNCGTVLLFVCV